MNKKKKPMPTIRSSAAEHLTFIAANGEGGVKAICADEDVWLSQKMLSALHDVESHGIHYSLKKIFSDNELEKNAVIRDFRITAKEGKHYNTKYYNFPVFIAVGYKDAERAVLQDTSKVNAKITRAHVTGKFEKYRIIQDKLHQSDFYKKIKVLQGSEQAVTKLGDDNE